MQTISYKPIDQLHNWTANYRHSDLGAIVTSIEKFGYNWPVAIDGDNVVRAGNHRLKALHVLLAQNWQPHGSCIQENGNGAEIACVDISHLSEDELVGFAIADNRTSALATDDNEQLAALLQQIASVDEQLLISSGYDGDDLDALLEELNPFEPPTDQGAQVDKAAELQEKWRVNRGDVWVIPSVSGDGFHRIVCGDSTCADDVALLMDGRRADAVVTDPPYGVDYERGKYDGTPRKSNMPIKIVGDTRKGIDQQRFIQSVFKIAKSHCKPNAVIYMFSAPLAEGAHSMFSLVDGGVHIQSQLIWNKSHFALGRSDYHWKHEIIWYGYWDGKDRIWNGERTQVSVIDAVKIPATLHPNEKPPSLLSVFINNSTHQHNIVYDPFLGSGTTMAACEMSQRICFGIEIDPRYCAVILERMVGLGLSPRLVEKPTGENIKLDMTRAAQGNEVV